MESVSSSLYREPVTEQDLLAFNLPKGTVGFMFHTLWHYNVGVMNGVLTSERQQNVSLSEVRDRHLINSVNGRGQFPETLDEARDIYVEIVTRLAEMPLNSGDIPAAHSLMEGISGAKIIICELLGIMESDKPSLSTLLGTE